MRKIYLIGYSSQNMDNKEKFSKLLEIEELKKLDLLYVGDSSNDLEISNYITDKSILKVDSRVGDNNLKYTTFPKNKDDVLSNGDTLANIDTRFTEFLMDILDNEEETVGVVVNNIIVLSFLQNMFELEDEGNSYYVEFYNKELLNGDIPNPVIFELLFTDSGEFSDINKIVL